MFTELNNTYLSARYLPSNIEFKGDTIVLYIYIYIHKLTTVLSFITQSILISNTNLSWKYISFKDNKLYYNQ